MKTMQIFECIANITIGNGAGQFPFLSHKTYTARDFRNACLTPVQVRAYFKPRNVTVRA